MVGDPACYLKTYELSNVYACKKQLGTRERSIQSQYILRGIGKENLYKCESCWEKTTFNQFFVNSRSKCKNGPNFDHGANCFGNISNE